MRIAVTGAGGRIGGQVVTLLAADPANDVVAMARRQPPPGAHPEQVITTSADYSDPAALHAALRGVDTLVFVSSDGPVAQVIVHHHNVIRAAVEGRVSHIVALSGLDTDPASPFCYAVSYAYTERLLTECGCSISIARASIYSEFFIGFLTQARAAGQLRVPAADGRISLISRTDVARCLATLAVARPTNRHHNITGPEALDLTAIASQAAQAWGSPLQYVDIAPSDYSREMADAGENPWWMYAYSTMFDSVREQRWAAVTDEVHRTTGRAPIALRDLLAGHKPT